MIILTRVLDKNSKSLEKTFSFDQPHQLHNKSAENYILLHFCCAIDVYLHI